MIGILLVLGSIFICASAGTLWLVLLICWLEMRRGKKAGKGPCWFCGRDENNT